MKKKFNKKSKPESLEKIAVELSIGRRKPKNKEGRNLKKSIDKVKAKGYFVDIPHD